MNVRYHRVAAISILASGLIVLLVWGRSMGIDTDEVRAIRDQFQGEWVATLVQAGEHRKREGAAAETCRVEFDGKTVAFHNLIGGIDARGTFYIEKPVMPSRVDFKLDAGWIIGIYEFDGDRLKICVNDFAPLEKLGVPSRPRPRQVGPAETHHYYVFQRSKPKA